MATIIKTKIYTTGEFATYPCAIDKEDGTVIIEYIVRHDDRGKLLINTSDSLKVTKENLESYIYKLPEDGYYTYYLLAVNTKERLEENGVDLNQDYVYYDEETDKIMKNGKEIEKLSTLHDLCSEINADSKYGILTLYQKSFFSICYLSLNLANSQRFVIFDSSKACEDRQAKLNRDFLFMTVYMLKELIRQERYEEAHRILASVSNCNYPNVSSPKYCGCR